MKKDVNHMKAKKSFDTAGTRQNEAVIESKIDSFLENDDWEMKSMENMSG